MDPKRRTESVLSKLMGLDRLPNQLPTHGQQKVLSESYFENIASIAHRDKWTFDEDRSRMDVDRQLETKHAFDERQRQVTSKPNHQPITKENAKLSIKKAEKDSILQDQHFQHPEDSAYSSRGLQYEHLSNVQDIASYAQFGHLTLSGSTSASAGKSSEIQGNMGVGTNHKLVRVKSFQSLDTPSFTKSHVVLGNSYLTNLLKSQSEKKKESCLSHTRVVLRSDNVNGHHAGISSSSPYSLSGDRRFGFSSSVRSKVLYFEAGGRRNMHQSMEPKHGSEFPGHIAKQINSEIKHSMWRHYSNLSGSETRSHNNFINEREKLMPCSPYHSNLKNSDEAASGVQDSAQMLDAPIPEPKYHILDSRLAEDSHLPGSDDRNMNLCSLSTSTIDGCKVGRGRDSPRPVVCPSTWPRRSRRRHFVVHRDWCLNPGENEGLECMKAWEGNYDPKGCLGTKDSRSVLSLDSENNLSGQAALPIIKDLNKLEEESLSEEISGVPSPGYTSACSDIEVVTNCKTQKIPDDLQDRLEETDLCLKNSMAYSMASGPLACGFDSLCVEGEEIGEMELQEESMTYLVPTLFQKDGESNLDDLDASVQQFRDDALMPSHFTETEKEPIEAYVGSPDSVLDSLEISSDAESNERTGNNIHVGLQMKLKFLEESLELDSEGHEMMVSSDEDIEEDSCGGHRECGEKMRTYNIEESRDFSYLVDVIVESGFDGGNLKKDCKIQKSFEFAINPLLFDALEKKYGKQASWKISERRLLFDRINLGLMEILQPCMGMGMEARSVVKRLVCLQHPELITDELWTWLVNQEKEARRESYSSVRVYARELDLLELDEDVSSIVQEIEKMLVDELVEEILSI
ncbi:hypothetical protein Ancab_023451 [Ancistrocladus abbreviatus]